MKTFSITNKPEHLVAHQKKTRVFLAFITEPFEVETQEGMMRIAPDTVDDWEDGYYVAYPEDGSKPYSIAPSYVRAHYIEVEQRNAIPDDCPG